SRLSGRHLKLWAEAADQRAARLLRRLERRGPRVYPAPRSADSDSDAAAGTGLELRIGEVRHAVGAHARGIPRAVLLQLRDLARRWLAVREVRLTGPHRRLEDRRVDRYTV